MKKLLTLITASTLAFYMQGCLEESIAAGDEEVESSSSVKDEQSSSSKAKSSSSKEKSSSSKAKSSSSKAKSSSSVAKSSDSKSKSSSSVAASSSSKAKSSSSVVKSSSSSAKSSSSVASSSSLASSSSVAESSSSEEVATTFVFGSNYMVGELRWIVDGKISEEKLEFNQDSRLRSVDGNLFVLERLSADNLALIDAKKKTVKWQIDLGANANPTDVVKANKDEIWLALDGAENFVKVAVKDGKITKTVKTGDFSVNNAGTPHLVDLEVSGDTLFALFQRYYTEGWNSVFEVPGLLAMYKLNNGDLLDTIWLETKNPTAMGFVKGKLYVASMGEYNDSYGTDADNTRGIELVDLSKKKSSLFVGGETLGGGIYDFVVDSKNALAYAVIYKFYGSAPIAKVNLADGSFEMLSINDAEGSLALDGNGVLYAGDRSYGAEAAYVYEAGVVTKIAAASADVLPPYSIAIVK